MRVIAGIARSIPLKTPEGDKTRPTTDRIKETLFNMICHELPDAVFADLFSGSGGIGMEAISRGAKRCYFVENDQTACRCIEENIKKCHFEDQSILCKQDVTTVVNGMIREKLDVIFMDPPYDHLLEKKVLELLSNSTIIDTNTLIIVEASLQTDLDYLEKLGYELKKTKTYKTNKHFFICKKKMNNLFLPGRYQL